MAALYYAVSKAASLMAIPPGYAVAIWPAAGIALVGVLQFGGKILPGIWLGSFLINFQISLKVIQGESSVDFVGLPALIGVGACAQAAFGSWLIRRYMHLPSQLLSEKCIAKFFLLGGPVSCLVGATWGILCLRLMGVLGAQNTAFAWSAWWIGDSIGCIAIAPATYLWLNATQNAEKKRALQVGVPIFVASIAVALVFLQMQICCFILGIRSGNNMSAGLFWTFDTSGTG